MIWKENIFFRKMFIVTEYSASSHLLYSFIVFFKYVNLIIWKEIYILGLNGLYFGGFREINALFSGFKGAQTLQGGSQVYRS